MTWVRKRNANAIHTFFLARDFHWVNAPIITASHCEVAGELFRVSTLDLVNLPRDKPEDFGREFFGAESVPHCIGSVERQSLLLCHVSGVHAQKATQLHAHRAYLFDVAE